MNRLDYFKARLEANMSPMEYRKAKKEHPENYVLVDVRVGPVTVRKEVLEGATVIPLNELQDRMPELPKEKTIVLYCWDTWCTLASKAAVLLLENGFDAKELYGGLAAWKTLDFPTLGLSEVASSSNGGSGVDCKC
ncbi:rhodanese-related sulfurtransferase [Salibacterium salarium]|uniref:rhodanese-like domain-containing protein n=1 Tax=Salibacterium salarium TaxID=284579 RepID=UPI00277F8BAC|nr:rhodanese-like domain-containing protein [Salibacterium salarium]MDQ0297992.1 rhodanese-related sulfurtransferase [Salibacterium salarium]